MDLNVRETLQIKDIILVERCLEGQAPGGGCGNNSLVLECENGLGAGKGDQENQARQRRKGVGWGEDFTREVAGIRTRESCWGQCGKGRPGVLLI